MLLLRLKSYTCTSHIEISVLFIEKLSYLSYRKSERIIEIKYIYLSTFTHTETYFVINILGGESQVSWGFGKTPTYVHCRGGWGEEDQYGLPQHYRVTRRQRSGRLTLGNHQKRNVRQE